MEAVFDVDAAAKAAVETWSNTDLEEEFLDSFYRDVPPPPEFDGCKDWTGLLHEEMRRRGLSD